MQKTKAIRNQYDLARQAELIRNVSTWQWNMDTNAIYWSENLFRIFGYTPYSIEPNFEKFISFVHPDDRAVIFSAVESMKGIDMGILPTIEYRIIDREGKLKHLRLGSRVVKTKNGKYVTGTVYDITDYVMIRQQLNRNDQLLQTIIDLDGDGISVYDNNLQCIMWNKRSTELYDKPKSEAIGKYLYDVIPTLKQKNLDGLIQQIMKDDLIVDADQHRIELDNHLIEITPVPNVTSEKTGLLVITRQKHSDAIEKVDLVPSAGGGRFLN